MILRIFTATIPNALHKEFEAKFKEISVPVVKNYKGFVSLEIAGPSQWNPEEFVMVSRWENEESLIAFAGVEWNQAHIPQGMEKYITSCSVSHYNHIDLPKT
ncbi:antibiotic biosynthesis monooxygenase [Muricauda sp. CAU 1633]|uniref:antibiotic biosynthesis monooxygenase family protein n=1 Tax=Allomuricauda sp. CAU 1633 TaxID=2816036 RepID=UPI001A8D5053|nr:antibiotic biosynthesis monooxygenase [Muricauda sp. CAU 1633]MBO0320776.1 antibiotic biosynthesis monooxygenase [Muricauda sp. CAU 1633]